jgi:hypothetical protein
MNSRLQVVFRDALDAVRWCLAVQMQLLNVSWTVAILSGCQEDAGTVTALASDSRAVPQALRDLKRKCCSTSVRT